MNTHLIGFGLKGTARLERWGKTIDVAISPESVELLKGACYDDLPTAAPYAPEKHTVRYEGSGVITAVITADQAQGMLAVLEDGVGSEALLQLRKGLAHALIVHEQYIDSTGDPGATG